MLEQLRVVFLVDLHWSGRAPLRLPDLEEVDLVLLGGDLTNFRGPDEARAIVEAVRATGAAVLAVCGNTDRREIESFLREEEIDLDRRARDAGGVIFAGISAGLPFGGTPYERTEDEFAAAAEDAFTAAAAIAPAGSPTVLVSHQPPRDTACDLARAGHVGSTAIRAAILRHQPDLVLCGHIHESAATDLLGRSRIVNPGPWFQGGVLRFRVTGGRIEIQRGDASDRPSSED
jgi:Icc-related predicted phosphoesterase